VDVCSLDITTGEIERWMESKTGRLNTHTFSEPQIISWPSFDAFIHQLLLQLAGIVEGVGGRNQPAVFQTGALPLVPVMSSK
jgi:hypothetical protein